MTDPAPRSPRRSLVARLRARPWLTAAAAAVGVGLVVFVLVWFQPQALFLDTVVDEEFPAAADAPPAGAAEEDDDADAEVDGATAEDGDADADAEVDGATAEDEGDAEVQAGPIELATGSFSSRNRYTVTGQATIFELEDGSRTLRLEDFESSNGPDLYVYLTAADEADTDAELDEDAIDLGVLRGNIGNQNYDVPSEVDLERYDTVVIWCRRFTSGFGAADLTAG